MVEQAVVEYLANCAWQIPLLALGAWVLLKVAKPGVRLEHALWLFVLALSVVLPACEIGSYPSATVVARHTRVNRHSISQHVLPLNVETGAQALPLPGMPDHARAMPVASAMPITEKRRRVTLHDVPLSMAGRGWLLAFYGATMMLAGLRFGRAWSSARRLVRASPDLVISLETMRELAECGARLRVKLPEVRQTTAIAGPVVVGWLRPVLLLPNRFAEHTSDEVRAALLHELAHVCRRDYLVNLVCQFAAMPVAWHPATRAIQRRIRLTREMVCDEMAAEQMQSGASYAYCLVELARQMLARQISGQETRTQALGLFDNNVKGIMEERVMRLTEIAATESMSERAKAIRTAVGVAAMLAVVSATLTFHLTPTFAATAAETVRLSGTWIQSGVAGVPVAAPAAVGASSDVAIPTVAPVAFSATLADVTLDPQVEPEQREKAAGVPSQAAAPDDDEPIAVAGKGGYVHRWVGADGKKYVTANHDPKEPTPEERLRIERNPDFSRKDLDEMKLDLAGLKKDLASPELKADLDEAMRLANDPKTKQQIREIQKQAAEIAKNAQLNLLNSPEWQKQMAEMQKFANDPAWQKQMAALEKNAQLNMLNSPEWKKQMHEMQKRLAVMQWNSAAMQLKVAQAQLSSPQVKDALAQAQKELESGEMKARLDAAQKTLDEVRKQMQELQPR